MTPHLPTSERNGEAHGEAETGIREGILGYEAGGVSYGTLGGVGLRWDGEECRGGGEVRRWQGQGQRGLPCEHGLELPIEVPR